MVRQTGTLVTPQGYFRNAAERRFLRRLAVNVNPAARKSGPALGIRARIAFIVIVLYMFMLVSMSTNWDMIFLSDLLRITSCFLSERQHAFPTQRIG